MIKRLLEELIKEDVPDREIMKHWANLGIIGSCLQEGCKCSVIYMQYHNEPPLFTIAWIKDVGKSQVWVKFDLTQGKIHHSINRRFHSVLLTKENIYLAVVWIDTAERVVKEIIDTADFEVPEIMPLCKPKEIKHTIATKSYVDALITACNLEDNTTLT